MDPATRINVRRAWLDCLHEFSCVERQRRWLGGDPDHAASFIECLCSYFDDLNLGEGLDVAVEEGWLLRQEADAVAEFHRLADEYEAPGEDSAVLADPAWSLVVIEARRAWLAVREHLTDVAENKLWRELEDGAIVAAGEPS